jgi:enamine deaminase RidA (YjgF/YER057c/UK114 family)
MEAIKRIHLNPTYSQIVIYKDTIYLSGQVPLETAGLPIYEQAQEVFKYIDNHLLTAGSDKTRILSIQIFLKDPADYPEMNRAFIEWIPDGSAPARNTICGVQFPTAAWGIECVVIAALI